MALTPWHHQMAAHQIRVVVKGFINKAMLYEHRLCYFSGLVSLCVVFYISGLL